MRPLFVLLLPTLFAGLPDDADAQCDSHGHQRIFASDGELGDCFSGSVDVDGEVMVVGAQHVQTAEGQTGAAYVFRFDGSQWIEEQKLVASDPQNNSTFGSAVAVEGETVIVGAFSEDGPQESSGAVYVYSHDGTAWVESQKLTATGAQSGENFGRSVDIDQGTIVAGAPGFSGMQGPNVGAAYVFRQDGTSWIQVQRLTASDAVDHDRMGFSIAVDGPIVVVGAEDWRGETGAAYAFEEDNGGFWIEHRLVASDGSTGRLFGVSVAVAGEVVAVGASAAHTDLGATGAVYVYRRESSGWSESKLVSRETRGSDRFGASVALDGDHLAVGAFLDHQDDVQDAGSASVFRDDGQRWVEQLYFSAADPERSDYTGNAVAMEGGTLVVSSHLDEVDGIRDAGSAHVLHISDLSLQITPEDLGAGDDARVETCGGRSGSPVALLITEVDGAPRTQWLTYGAFRSDGLWLLQNTVPPGLSGLELTLMSIGFVQENRPGESNRARISFH